MHRSVHERAVLTRMSAAGNRFHVWNGFEAEPPAEPMRSAMLEYFVRSADFMRNTEEPDPSSSETP